MNAYSLIDQLYIQGVRHFCLAPGSRSTLLVLAALKTKAQIHVHFDERGLGFFALGIAKAYQEPVAVIVTSGTAVGNLLPAVMEAHHSCIPLIVLTADRPPDLRDCSANQACDQIKIFSSYVRYQTDLGMANQVRSIAAHAYFMAVQNPPGPVHINCPFEEPLWREMVPTDPYAISTLLPKLTAPLRTKCSKGLIAVGKLPNPSDIYPILELTDRLSWPIFFDVLSSARGLTCKQRVKRTDTQKSEFILHFGERLTTEKLKNACHVSPYPALQDPERNLSMRVQSDIPEFCKTFSANTDPMWLSSWQETEISSDHFLSNLELPEEYALFFGNGLSVREADRYFYPKHRHSIYANRGLSGIDGNIATIAGLAQKSPVFALIGDQAALYDLNSLALLKNTPYPVMLVIMNNFGGAIFDTLPIHKHQDFSKYWRAGHSYQFEKAAAMFDLPYSHSMQTVDKSSLIEIFSCSLCTT